MGNCVTNRHIEDEAETCNMFKVTNLDSNKKPVTSGTLKVMQSGVMYTSNNKKETVMWKWHQVLKIACERKIFVLHVSSEGGSEYWFSCKNVVLLFVRVNDYIANQLQMAATDIALNSEFIRRTYKQKKATSCWYISRTSSTLCNNSGTSL